MATTNQIKANERRGAVIPLFGLLLPVLVMVAAFAINVAYMQLTTTELRVATDAAARAGGRAWSEYQSIDDAKEFAVAAAANNIVAGAPLLLEMSDGLNEIEFGLSRRADNGYGRYEFTKKPTPDVAAGTTEATSIRITGKRDNGSRSGSVSLLFGGVGDLSVFQPKIASVCTQVDRDIALILDRFRLDELSRRLHTRCHCPWQCVGRSLRLDR
jgi:Ca-activated chloride channel family protein